MLAYFCNFLIHHRNTKLETTAVAFSDNSAFLGVLLWRLIKLVKSNVLQNKHKHVNCILVLTFCLCFVCLQVFY